MVFESKWCPSVPKYSGLSLSESSNAISAKTNSQEVVAREQLCSLTQTLIILYEMLITQAGRYSHCFSSVFAARFIVAFRDHPRLGYVVEYNIIR